MINEALIDYHKCHEYARSLCGSYGIPPCDVGDIGSDAFLLSIRRAWHAEPGTNEEAVARRLMYTSVVDVIRRRNNKAIRILSDAEELYRDGSGDDTPNDDDTAEDRFAATERRSVTDTVIELMDWQNPFWLRLFDGERKKLRKERRKSALAENALGLVKAGLKDPRLWLHKENRRISGSRFRAILDFCKMRFDLCFQALRAWRG